MPVYALGSVEPRIDDGAYVHPEAVIIGDVEVGSAASIWPHAVLRGDDGRIVVGAQTSVQDGVVIHCTDELDTVIGARCTIGHLAHLEGCVIEDEALVGSGAVVLHRAVVGSGALVGAGAVVPNDLVVPPRAMALGVPARIREDAVDPAILEMSVSSYLARAVRYRAELRRIS